MRTAHLVTCAALASAPASARADVPEQSSWSDKAVLFGLRFDLGEESTSIGLGVHHAWRSGFRDRHSIDTWASAGLDLRLATSAEDQATVIGVPLRVASFGFPAVGGFELWAGTPLDDAQAVASVGVFYSALYVDLGYSYGFAVTGDRADWLASHQVSLRVQFPVFLYSRAVTFTASSPSARSAGSPPRR